MEWINGEDNVEDIQDEYAEQLLSSDSFDTADVFGDPAVLPRVGLEYQAEIPALVEDCNRLHLVPATRSKLITNHQNCLLLELPIPLMWSGIEVENINGTAEFENSDESQVTSLNEHMELRVEPVDYPPFQGYHKEVHSEIQLTSGDEKTAENSVQESDIKIYQAERVLCPLPGSLGESWTVTECDSFLLALYIFGKNLTVVKRFVDSKEMGDMLSFYYGQFYGSDGYRRWADCRKLRSKRNINGQKIFSGWRQQELLSRLFSQVSQECQSMLVEASRTFGEEKITLEEYVFTLKGAVGVSMLAQAVGIGKGKHDLTGTSMEPTKPSNISSIRPDIPIGKACSSLTSGEIINFLMGGFRLSKARSSDLFWEAVWPRLLARGWHSEQPKDHGISGSKSSLVFLVPGIKKFSRRRLVKGNHFFDSISDVLSKVASDPGLLELEDKAVNGNGQKEECRLNSDLKQEKDHSSNKQRHCYLQPPHLNSNHHAQKFTVVDTSLAYGAGQPKVRELRSLPVGTCSASTSSRSSSESEEDTSEESQEQQQEINTSNCASVVGMRTYLDSADGVKNRLMPNALDLSVGTMGNPGHQSRILVSNKQQRKTVKYQFSRKAKSGGTKYMVPHMKQQGFASGDNTDLTCSTKDVSAERKLNEDESPCTSSSPGACEEAVFQVGPPLNFSSSLAKENTEGSDGGFIGEKCPSRVESPEKPPSHKLTDLNVPDASIDFGANKPIIVDATQKNDVLCENQSIYISESSQKPEHLKLPDATTPVEQQPSTNSRRQSTRNRPLTMKALEALELGFFGATKKRKNTETTESKSKTKYSRQLSGSTGKENPDNGTEKDLNGPGIREFSDGLHNNPDIVGR